MQRFGPALQRRLEDIRLTGKFLGPFGHALLFAAFTPVSGPSAAAMDRLPKFHYRIDRLWRQWLKENLTIHRPPVRDCKLLKAVLLRQELPSTMIS